jgi:putative SOS response-associated peptidase YedK
MYMPREDQGFARRTTQEEELARLYHIPIPKQPDLPVSYNIAPSQNVLATRFNPETREGRRRRRSLDQLSWGLIPHWAKTRRLLTEPSTRGLRPSIKPCRTARHSSSAAA